MKKFASAILALALAATLPLGLSAAGESAFENVMITADTKLYDEGGTDNPIAYMEAYGVGYSSKGDQVIFEDIDFGENGADKMYINFSYGNESNSTNLEVYIDEVAGEPAAKYNIGYTGGWESTYAEEFETDISVPAGTHDIIVLFTDETGSFNYIRFDEAPPAPVEEAPAEAPQTADPLTITAAIAAASAAGAVVLKKRAK